MLVEVGVISAHFYAETHEVVLDQSATGDALLFKFEFLAKVEARV